VTATYLWFYHKEFFTIPQNKWLWYNKTVYR